MTKRERRRLSDDGLPIDAKAWTEADWRDLHRAMETVRWLVGHRHAGGEAAGLLVCPHCKGTGRTNLGAAYRKTWERIKSRAAEFTAATLAREWGVPATRINNQLAALERHGLLSSSPSGRERLYRVKGN
jgi:hypothetical protein